MSFSELLIQYFLFIKVCIQFIDILYFSLWYSGYLLSFFSVTPYYEMRFLFNESLKTQLHNWSYFCILEVYLIWQNIKATCVQSFHWNLSYLDHFLIQLLESTTSQKVTIHNRKKAIRLIPFSHLILFLGYILFLISRKAWC